MSNFARRYIPESLSEKRSRAGRLGALATHLRYGREKMREWGSRGGRPRLPTLGELERQFGAPENKTREELLTGGSRGAP